MTQIINGSQDTLAERILGEQYAAQARQQRELTKIFADNGWTEEDAKRGAKLSAEHPHAMSYIEQEYRDMNNELGKLYSDFINILLIAPSEVRSHFIKHIKVAAQVNMGQLEEKVAAVLAVGEQVKKAASLKESGLIVPGRNA